MDGFSLDVRDDRNVDDVGEKHDFRQKAQPDRPAQLSPGRPMQTPSHSANQQPYLQPHLVQDMPSHRNSPKE